MVESLVEGRVSSWRSALLINEKVLTPLPSGRRMEGQPEVVTPLSGPYPILELNYWTKSNAPGIFVLRNESGRAERVGSSDRDLRSAISAAAQETGASQFFMEYASSEARLFLICCILFHAFDLAMRQAHPLPVHGAVDCPVPGCPLNKEAHV
jgi:hypothetical protein